MSQHTFRRLWAIGSLALLAAGMATAQHEVTGRQRPMGRERVPFQVGQLAPDFALPRLDPFLETNAVASAKTVERVRLSALRGKRPVVLIFSSFT